MSYDEDEATRVAEWQAFLLGVPAEHRIDLNTTHTVTAFHQARLRGWEIGELSADVAATYARAPGATGIVVSRLQALAKSTKPSNDVMRTVYGTACPFACQRGWLGEDDEGNASPCPNCKPHLQTCPTCGVWRVRGISHACRGSVDHRPVGAVVQDPPGMPGSVRERIPPDWAKERMELLQRCRDMTPDEAEQPMRDLIRSQRSRGLRVVLPS